MPVFLDLGEVGTALTNRYSGNDAVQFPGLGQKRKCRLALCSGMFSVGNITDFSHAARKPRVPERPHVNMLIFTAAGE